MSELSPIWLGERSGGSLPGEFTLTTWNVWFDKRLRAERNAALLDELEAVRPHVMLFQEVTPPFVRALQAAEWLREGYWVSGVEHNEIGVVMVARVRPQSVRFQPLTSAMGRRLLVVDFEGLRVVGGHFESNRGSGEMREIQFREALRALEDAPRGVLAGDFNCDPADPECRALNRLKDAWTATNSEAGYTLDTDVNETLRAQVRGQIIAARLDRVLLSGEIEARSAHLLGTQPFQGRDFISDHFGLSAVLGR